MKKLKKIMIPVDIVLGVLIVAMIALIVVVQVSADKTDDSVSFKVSNDEDTEGTSAERVEEWEFDDFSSSSDSAQDVEVYSALTDPDAYILEYSDYWELEESDLDGLTEQELYLGMCEIEARHGKVFDAESVNEYFTGKTWYETNGEYSVDDLSETELVNIDFISNYMDENDLTYVP